ncbi:MAG: NBR1-Ig-like domain-containing protein, partial [Anaerolineaceae bacterium]|nr:NBR1-Ig-like domain-containing protein [Anaerolineaceae bacterium]
LTLILVLTSCNFQLADIFDLNNSQTGNPNVGIDEQVEKGQIDNLGDLNSGGNMPEQNNTITSDNLRENDLPIGEIVLSEHCNHISPGNPMDLTISDGTQMEPGESFIKIWRLVNTGTCSWTQEYSIIWFSGEFPGYFQSQTFDEVVLPGQSVDIKIEMITPDQPGFYQSNWKIRSSNGNLFGIGPRGSAPFWVNIEVVGEQIFLQDPEPTMTSLEKIILSGNATLATEDHFDLDQGEVNPSSGSDISFFVNSEDIEYLAPSINVDIGIFGMTQPSLDECKSLPLDNIAHNLNELEIGVFICYRSNDGLPGYFQFLDIDRMERVIMIDYVTWSAP